jgi:hypothetical protein
METQIEVKNIQIEKIVSKGTLIDNNKTALQPSLFKEIKYDLERFE